jgi:hypothetical protein
MGSTRAAFSMESPTMSPLRRAQTLVVTLLIAACATTTFKGTYTNPDAKALSFQRGDKVLAVVVSTDETVRRSAEDALASELTHRGMTGVPAYTILPTELAKDSAAAQAAATLAGIVGVVSMRAVKVGKETTTTSTGMYSGPGYATYWGGGHYGYGYYGYGWAAPYNQTYTQTDTIVTVETLVFDLRQDKLVWGGLSETTNPDKIEALIEELVVAAATELNEQGLVR